MNTLHSATVKGLLAWVTFEIFLSTVCSKISLFRDLPSIHTADEFFITYCSVPKLIMKLLHKPVFFDICNVCDSEKIISRSPLCQTLFVL
jgi:hypothetical protein